MRPAQGFYRVDYMGHPGVAHCRPDPDGIEVWSVLYTRDVGPFKDMAVQYSVSSRGNDFSSLKVLGKIEDPA